MQLRPGSQSRMCVDEDADVSGTVSVPHHVKTLWQSFVFSVVMTITTACLLHCTSSVSPSSGLFSHCVAETGLKYQVECLTCTCAGFPLSVTRTWHYHKRQTKPRLERVLFSFFISRCCGDYVLLLSRQSVKGKLRAPRLLLTVLIATFTAELMNWDI